MNTLGRESRHYEGVRTRPQAFAARIGTNIHKGRSVLCFWLVCAALLLLCGASGHAAEQQNLPNELLLENPPQTQNELLQRIKTVLATAGITGPEVIKNISGLDIVKATTVDGVMKYFKLPDGQSVYYDKVSHRKRVKVDEYRAYTYIKRGVAETEASFVWEFLYIYHDDNDFLFGVKLRDKKACITPKTVQEVFGSASHARASYGGDMYFPVLAYKKSLFPSELSMEIYFNKKFNSNAEAVRTFWKKYLNATDMCATEITLEHYRY